MSKLKSLEKLNEQQAKVELEPDAVDAVKRIHSVINKAKKNAGVETLFIIKHPAVTQGDDHEGHVFQVGSTMRDPVLLSKCILVGMLESPLIRAAMESAVETYRDVNDAGGIEKWVEKHQDDDDDSIPIPVPFSPIRGQA